MRRHSYWVTKATSRAPEKVNAEEREGRTRDEKRSEAEVVPLGQQELPPWNKPSVYLI